MFIATFIFPLARGKNMAPAVSKMSKQFNIELVVRTINNFKNQEDVAAFFDVAKKAGVAAVHINVKQDEDDERPSGEVYYNSKIAPVAAGYEKFDALAASIKEGHERGIAVYAWMPQFHDQAALRAHPGWQMMASEKGASKPYKGKTSIEYFVNPIDPEVQEYELSLIMEVVKNYNVDGISLDWLRYDDINMDTGPYTRNLARKEIDVDPLDINFSKQSAVVDRWSAWRAQKIGTYVKKVRLSIKQVRPDIRLTAFLLPPEFVEVGQNLALFSSDLDEVHPMAYFKDWDFPPDWVSGKLMNDIVRKRSASKAIIPTLDGTGTMDQNVHILSGIQKKFPGVKSIAWFSAVYWEPAQIAFIKRIHDTAEKKAIAR